MALLWNNELNILWFVALQNNNKKYEIFDGKAIRKVVGICDIIYFVNFVSSGFIA